MSVPGNRGDRQFSWLQFSAFQFRAVPSAAYARAREALYQDLAALHGRLGPWHAVAVTGDVAFSGQPDLAPGMSMPCSPC